MTVDKEKIDYTPVSFIYGNTIEDAMERDPSAINFTVSNKIIMNGKNYSGVTSEEITENLAGVTNSVTNKITNITNEFKQADAELKAEIAGLKSVDAELRSADGRIMTEITGLKGADAILRSTDGELKAAIEGLKRVDSGLEGRLGAAEEALKHKVNDDRIEGTLTNDSNKIPSSEAVRAAIDAAVDSGGQASSDLGKRITSVEKQIAGHIDNVIYDSSGKKIRFEHGGKSLCEIDASDFVKDGMVDSVKIERGKLVISFNTDAGKSPVEISLSKIFDPNNFYDKNDIDEKLRTVEQSVPSVEVQKENTGKIWINGEAKSIINPEGGKVVPNVVSSLSYEGGTLRLKQSESSDVTCRIDTYSKSDVDEKVRNVGSRIQVVSVPQENTGKIWIDGEAKSIINPDGGKVVSNVVSGLSYDGQVLTLTQSNGSPVTCHIDTSQPVMHLVWDELPVSF